MNDRYPLYDVLSKRETPSWNEQTRRVVDKRVATLPDEHAFFSDEEWPTVRAICARITPQPADRPQPAPVAALVDEKLHKDHGDGYRNARLPRQRDAWRRGLAAIDAEARLRHRARFHELKPEAQDEILKSVEEGKAQAAEWGDMPPKLFFSDRLLHDAVTAYYACPVAWNEIGFGGPASPRGYVRTNFDRRDHWEASEARPGREEPAARENASVGKF